MVADQAGTGRDGKSLRSTLYGLISWITVEPVEFFYCLMFTTSNIVRDNLFLEKACLLDLGYSEEVCYNLTHDESGELDDEIVENVQRRVTELELWDGVIVALPSIVFCLFVGTWSDYHGRKPVLIFPFIGNILSYIFYMLNYFYYDWPTDCLLLGSVVGLFGGYTCLNMGLYGYVADVTSTLNRTMRLSILNGAFSAAYVVGTSLGGVLYKYNGNYYVIFGTSCLFGMCGILWTIFLVKESVVSTPEERRKHKFFDLNNVKESLRVAFRPRPDRGRLHILLLVLNFALFMFPLNTYHWDYLLVQLKFDWQITEYSKYLSIQRICRMLGLFFLVPLLSRILKLNDSLIAACCTLFTVAAYLLIALGQNPWVMYLSAVLQFNSVITVIIRSQCTKAVEVSEIGRIFAVVALGQSIVPFIAAPLFGLVYKATLDTFPGAYLIIVSALLFVAFLSSVFLYIDNRRRLASTS